MSALLFSLEYEINGLPTDCGFRRVTKADETHFMVCAIVNGEQREFEMRIDYDKNGAFAFTSKDVPKALLEAEDEISDTIFHWDTFTAGDDGITNEN